MVEFLRISSEIVMQSEALGGEGGNLKLIFSF